MSASVSPTRARARLRELKRMTFEEARAMLLSLCHKQRIQCPRAQICDRPRVLCLRSDQTRPPAPNNSQAAPGRGRLPLLQELQGQFIARAT
jgi:hypothetical protein